MSPLNCKKHTLKLNIVNYIRYHGKVEKDEVKKIYEQAHVFTFPSIRETSGNVLLEALAIDYDFHQ